MVDLCSRLAAVEYRSSTQRSRSSTRGSKNACPYCIKMATFWHTDRAEYHERVRLRRTRRESRDAKQAQIARDAFELLERQAKLFGYASDDDPQAR